MCLPPVSLAEVLDVELNARIPIGVHILAWNLLDLVAIELNEVAAFVNELKITGFSHLNRIIVVAYLLSGIGIPALFELPSSARGVHSLGQPYGAVSAVRISMANWT